MHYLPHHPVIRTDKSTSRVRIVYDASAKRDGPSLNDCLETGPNTLPQIIDILLRFRLNKIALISDIKQAFLNVSIPESDRDFLRFLWVNDINSNETEIIIRRFAFGTTASPPRHQRALTWLEIVRQFNKGEVKSWISFC